MKVLMINGSPHVKGNTYTALHEMEKVFAENGVETELVMIGNQDIRGMPIATGQYWNGIHGRELGEAEADAEGLQMMRTLAHNMVFLMESIALGKEKYGLPRKEPFVATNFVR